VRRGRAGRLLAATGTLVALSLSGSPAFAAGQGEGGGATIEEFVCFRETGNRIALGTGKVVTTPSGEVHVVCTGEPLS
jgi:hypothetical protein